MATPIADRCLLVKFFAEFDLLPNLLAMAEDIREEAVEATPGPLDPDLRPPLDEDAVIVRWEQFLAEAPANLDHIEPFDHAFRDTSYWHFARDVMDLAHQVNWVEAPTVQSKVLSDIGRRPWESRDRETERTIELALRTSVEEHYRGRDGVSVVELVQSGANLLSTSTQAWAQVVPGLLLIEFWALIYCAFRTPLHALELRDRLVANRQRAIQWHGGSTPGDDVVTNQTFLADATGSLYLDDSQLAARTGLNITGARSTATLLTYCRLLREDCQGPVSFFVTPRPRRANG